MQMHIYSSSTMVDKRGDATTRPGLAGDPTGGGRGELRGDRSVDLGLGT